MTTEIIETAVIDDVFCMECAKVERLGPCLRLIFAVPHTETFGPGYRIVVARLVIPEEEIAAVAAALLARPAQKVDPASLGKAHKSGLRIVDGDTAH
jgi:hypothetical protein